MSPTKAHMYVAQQLSEEMETQADNINTLVNAAGIKMEPYWANLFSKLFANKNIGDLIANVGAGERPGSADAWDVLMRPCIQPRLPVSDKHMW